MVELVILACLAAEPDRCGRFRVPFYAPRSTLECMFQGQIYMKDWAEGHPRWQVKGWRCTPPEA